MRKMVYRVFMEGKAKRLFLEGVDAGCFATLLNIWCGREVLEVKELDVLMMLAGLADRFKMMELGEAFDH